VLAPALAAKGASRHSASVVETREPFNRNDSANRSVSTARHVDLVPDLVCATMMPVRAHGRPATVRYRPITGMRGLRRDHVSSPLIELDRSGEPTPWSSTNVQKAPQLVVPSVWTARRASSSGDVRLPPAVTNVKGPHGYRRGWQSLASESLRSDRASCAWRGLGYNRTTTVSDPLTDAEHRNPGGFSNCHLAAPFHPSRRALVDVESYSLRRDPRCPVWASNMRRSDGDRNYINE